MSIISDALKKASQEKNVGLPSEKSTGVTGEAQKDSASLPLQKNILRYRYIFYAVALAGVIGLFIATNLNQGKPLPAPGAGSSMQASQNKGGLSENLSGQTGQQKSAAAVETPEFVLTGIVHGEGEPMAIINGGVYFKGDIIKSAKIIDISEYTVVLDKNGKQIELKVK